MNQLGGHTNGFIRHLFVPDMLSYNSGCCVVSSVKGQAFKNLSQHRSFGEFHASLDFLSLSGTPHLKPRLIFLVARYNLSCYWLCFGYRERSHLLKDSLRLWHKAHNPVNFVALETSSASLLQHVNKRCYAAPYLGKGQIYSTRLY